MPLAVLLCMSATEHTLGAELWVVCGMLPASHLLPATSRPHADTCLLRATSQLPLVMPTYSSKGSKERLFSAESLSLLGGARLHSWLAPKQ